MEPFFSKAREQDRSHITPKGNSSRHHRLFRTIPAQVLSLQELSTGHYLSDTEFPPPPGDTPHHATTMAAHYDERSSNTDKGVNEHDPPALQGNREDVGLVVETKSVTQKWQVGTICHVTEDSGKPEWMVDYGNDCIESHNFLEKTSDEYRVLPVPPAPPAHQNLLEGPKDEHDLRFSEADVGLRISVYFTGKPENGGQEWYDGEIVHFDPNGVISNSKTKSKQPWTHKIRFDDDDIQHYQLNDRPKKHWKLLLPEPKDEATSAEQDVPEEGSSASSGNLGTSTGPSPGILEQASTPLQEASTFITNIFSAVTGDEARGRDDDVNEEDKPGPHDANDLSSPKSNESYHIRNERQLDVTRPGEFTRIDYRAERAQRDDLEREQHASFQVHIGEKDLQRIKAFTLEFPHLETGGDLFGVWNQDGSCTVTAIIGPGSDATRTSVTWNQSETYLVSVHMKP